MTTGLQRVLDALEQQLLVRAQATWKEFFQNYFPYIWQEKIHLVLLEGESFSLVLSSRRRWSGVFSCAYAWEALGLLDGEAPAGSGDESISRQRSASFGLAEAGEFPVSSDEAASRKREEDSFVPVNDQSICHLHGNDIFSHKNYIYLPLALVVRTTISRQWRAAPWPDQGFKYSGFLKSDEVWMAES